MIPTPVREGGEGKIDIALDFERRKFYKLETQLSNCEAENGLVIWSWCFQKHLWEGVLSQWGNIGSAPQTPKGRKVGFCLFLFKETCERFWPRHCSLSGNWSIYLKNGLFFFFLTPVQKLQDDKPHPLPRPQPQGIVLGSSQLGSFVSTCTFKRIWGQIQGKIFFS